MTDAVAVLSTLGNFQNQLLPDLVINWSAVGTGFDHVEFNFNGLVTLPSSGTAAKAQGAVVDAMVTSAANLGYNLVLIMFLDGSAIKP